MLYARVLKYCLFCKNYNIVKVLVDLVLSPVIPERAGSTSINVWETCDWGPLSTNIATHMDLLWLVVSAVPVGFFVYKEPNHVKHFTRGRWYLSFKNNKAVVYGYWIFNWNFSLILAHNLAISCKIFRPQKHLASWEKNEVVATTTFIMGFRCRGMDIFMMRNTINTKKKFIIFFL